MELVSLGSPLPVVLSEGFFLSSELELSYVCTPTNILALYDSVPVSFRSYDLTQSTTEYSAISSRLKRKELPMI